MTTREISAQSNWLRRLIAPPRFNDDEDKTRTAQYLNATLLSGIVLLCVRLLAGMLTPDIPSTINELLIALLAIMIGLLIVMRRGYVRAASVSLLGAVLLIMVIVADNSEGVHDGAYFVMTAIVVMASLLIDWKASAVVAGLSIAAGWWLASKYAGVPQQLKPSSATDFAVDSSIVLILIVVLMYLVVNSLQQALKRSRASEQNLRQQNVELLNLRKTLEDRVTTRTEELQASAEVGRAAASILDTDQLLSQIVNLIVERFGLYYAAVFIVDEMGQTAVLQRATGEAGHILKERHHQLDVGGQSMVGQAIAKRQARIALDVGTEAVRFANPLLPDTRSEIALPLVVGDRVLGALDVQSVQAAAFDEASAAVLQSMADQVAVALSNAEQFNQTSAALQQAETLSKSIQALVGASDIQAVGQYLAEYANTLVAADQTFVFVVDHEQRRMLVQVASGNVVDQEPHTYDSLNSGISGLVFKSGQPVLSISADDGIEPVETKDRRKRYGIGALIVVPLVANGRVIGTVTTLNRLQQRVFTDRDVDLLMTLAAQSVSVIEKLRLFEQAQRAASDLDAVNRRLTGAAWNEFTLQHATTGARWISTTNQAQPIDLPEVGEALSTGQIAIRPLDGSGQLGIAVPIKVRDVSVGALRLVVPQQTWNDDLSTSLQSIAGHVAQAAETARLLEQTERDAQREKAISGAADKIHRAMSMDTVLQTAIAEINRITGLAGVSIQLGFEQTEVAEGNGHGATS
jgi:GAF domain-containing protein